MNRNSGVVVMIAGKSPQVDPFEAGDGADLDPMPMAIRFTRWVQGARRHQQLEQEAQQQE